MKYSIVMPIYNVEKYLKRSASDIRGQSFQDFELILVDDCSPDASGTMCDQLMSEDQRIKVVHLPQNGGLSNARNQGMTVAEGEYILFLDPDDRYDSHLLEEIEKSLKVNRAQVVIYGLVEEYYDKNENIEYQKQILPEKGYINNALDVREQVLDLESCTLFGYAWNKAYDLAYLRELGVQYQKVTMIEDVLFNIEVFKSLTSCNLIAKPLYRYAIRKKGSLTTKYLPNYFELHEQRVDSLCRLYQEWKMETPEVLKRLGSIYCRYFLSALQRNAGPASKMSAKKQKRWIKKQFKSQTYMKLKPFLYPDNCLLKILAWGVRNEKTSFCLLMGQGIYFVKEKCPGLFSRLKQNR